VFHIKVFRRLYIIYTRCPTHPRRGKTSPSLPFLRIAACMCCLYVCFYVHVYVFVCVLVCVSMAAVYVLVCVPDVFLLCLLRCPNRPTMGKTSPSLPFLRIAACMYAYVFVCVFICVHMCMYVCLYVCLYVWVWLLYIMCTRCVSALSA